MTTTIYANYGLLGAEKRTVYSTRRGEVSDTLSVNIPDDLYAGTNGAGEVLIGVAGITYLLDEVLCGDNAPCLRCFDGDGYVLRMLSVVGDN